MGVTGTATTRAPTFAYQPALDGVRAVAVLGVLLFHGGVAFLPGGFLGVDAFFVLSGFLITSLLLAEHDRVGRVRLPAFWGRRARRLLPALLVMLAAVVVLGRVIVPPEDTALLRGDTLAALGYVANWRMIYRGSGYFAQTADPSPLQHTWSLGIEEQFYLLWPLVVVLALRWRRGRAGLLAVALLGTVASVVMSFRLYRPDDPDRDYFGTDSRAQALLIGCALAILLARATVGNTGAGWDRWLGGVALAGLAALAWLWTHANGSADWLYRGGLTIAALSVAAVLAHTVVHPRSVTARLLAVAPLVWLGRISYGVYLWHWPLYALLNADRTGLAGPALLGVRVGLTLLVAAASAALVELPVRRGVRPRWLPSPRWAAPVGVTVVAVAASAALAAAASALPALTPAGAVRSAILPMPAAPAPTGTSASHAPPPTQRPGRRPGALPRVDFFGDSVSWTLGTYLPDHPQLDVHVPAIQGCGITLLDQILELGTPHTLYPNCPEWPSRWRSAVEGDDPDVSVILLDRWEFMDATLDGQYQHVGQASFDGYLMGQLDQAVSIAGSRGARVVLLTAPYTHRAETPSGGLYPEDQPARVDAWNALLRGEAAKHPGTVTVLDLNRVVCPQGTFTWSINGLRVRSDGLHFTPAGVAQLIAPWLLPQLQRLATTGNP
ncbi:MAG TPA: acyltransferase family protein [Micromonosporaceae bacterium]|jgi:peptidoglycan/LPS O-acetylase OafA/YrhL